MKTKIEFLTNVGKEKDFEIYELKNEIEKIRNKCGKTEKEESEDSNEFDSGFDEKTGNDSESIFDNKKIKKKKIPILNLQDSTERKKKKKKKNS